MDVSRLNQIKILFLHVILLYFATCPLRVRQPSEQEGEEVLIQAGRREAQTIAIVWYGIVWRRPSVDSPFFP